MLRYVPMPGSVAHKVVEYFTTNPTEELTTSDLEAKFGKKSTQFHSLLATSVDKGLLKRVFNADDELVYCMGTGVPEIPANPGAHPSLKTDALLLGAQLGKRASSRRPHNTWPMEPATPDAHDVDPLTIELRQGVPLPAVKRSDDRWQTLIGRMEVGDSFEASRRHFSLLSKHCTQLKKAGAGVFALRRVSADSVGVWRIK